LQILVALNSFFFQLKKRKFWKNKEFLQILALTKFWFFDSKNKLVTIICSRVCTLLVYPWNSLSFLLERENTVFPMNCVLSFTQIRCKFRWIHVEDPLTPAIFSLSQIDELVRG
jgi:hypothetical protein